MINNYSTYIKENNDYDDYKVGDRVIIRDDSEHRNQAYYCDGNGMGKITHIRPYSTYYDSYLFEIEWDNGRWNVYRLKDIELSKNKKRIERPDVDPFGEEDWGWEITESNEYKFQTGDRVILKGNVDGRNLDGKIGTIDGFQNDNIVNTNIRNGKMVDRYNFKGNIYHITFDEEGGWWVSPENMESINKNKKRIERPDVDPYGEEDWGWEEIKESFGIDYEFCVRIENKQDYDKLMKYFEENGYEWRGPERIPTEKKYRKDMEVIYSEAGKYLLYSDLEYHTRNYNDTPICSVEFIINNKKYKKIEKPELDPYGEEDWGYEEITESVNPEDPLGIKNHVIFYKDDLEVLEIYKILTEYDYVIYDHQQTLLYESKDWCAFGPYIRDIGKYDFILCNGKHIVYEDYPKITLDELKKKIGYKKRKKKTNPEVDPYGEEDWGWEEITENVNSEYDVLLNYNITFKNTDEAKHIFLDLQKLGFIVNVNDVEYRISGWTAIVPSLLKGKGFCFGKIDSGERETIDFENFLKITNAKYKKIENPELDPYGEEDWGYEKIK